MSSCPFCHPAPDRVCHESDLVVALWDLYPVSPGHCLLVPRRHVATWWEATLEERVALVEATDAVKGLIEQSHRPDGYNLGVNSGEAAGQTLHHLHLHLIPRYRGDVPDPRGGVRHVVPSKANYLDRRLEGAPHSAPLIRGGEDPLYPHLRHALERAVGVDLAVAFIQRSGWRRMEEHLRDVLRRGGRVRVLAGDYLDVTDPDALDDLLLLADQFEGVEARVFETRQTSFHPKCYRVEHGGGSSLAFVGSSNLSEPALGPGIEWNYRALEAEGVAEVQRAFEELFRHPATRPLDGAWVDHYRARRAPLQTGEALPVRVELEPPEPPPEPHGIQQDALAALERTRARGHRAGLVVLATGLGKTWLAAFDSRPFRRVLFVAHREEILAQAAATFRRVRPEARCGFYKGTDRDPGADVLFASVQTLGKAAHLERFPRDRFDYVVVDEFHHASARTYRQVLDHFQPHFLLGLTATPERTDGGDLLALCGENLVYRCDLAEGIRRGLLCPFHYFGIPDEVDYSTLPWRSSRFDPEELTSAVATESRAAHALDQYRLRGGIRTVAFCCSVRHARFMRDFFARAGVRCAAVHSDGDSDPRAASLEKLAAGELDVVFTVDMFNEGVDLPALDTVLMLRPTESRILWLQQFGRGLRRAEGKERLRVLDYLGNHRTFLVKPQALFGLPPGDAHLARTLDLLRKGEVELPVGCEVTFDLQAVEILEGLLRTRKGQDALLLYYQDFREREGVRPRAVEAFHDGYNPRSVRARYGSWFGLARAQGDLSAEEEEALEVAPTFLSALETTPVEGTPALLVLEAWLETGRFPSENGRVELEEALARVVLRDPRLAPGPAPEAFAEANPSVVLEDGRIRLRGRLPARADALAELARELVAWRLAEFLSRPEVGWTLKVNHAAGGQPILFPLDRKRYPNLPLGPTTVEVEGEAWTFRFVKVAVNVAERPGFPGNQLPGLLRRWFGPGAGAPGTLHRVRVEASEGGYRCTPVC